jgi:glycosyltransferase 2 family protein
VAVIFYFIGNSLAEGWEELVAADLSFAPLGLIASIGLLGLYMLGRALIWHHLTDLLGSAIPLGKAVMAWFYSQLGKYVPGKVFLYLGRLHYYTREGKGAGKVSLAFGLELVATFSSSILMVLLSALTLESPRVDSYRPVLLIVLVALVLALHPRVLTHLTRVAYRLLRREPFEITVSYGELLRFVGFYVLNWLIFGLSLYMFINSFYPLAASSILYLAGAFSFASMMGMVAVFVPSGLGVREGLLGIFLVQLMPQSVSLLSAVAARVWFTVVELLGVGVVAVLATDRPAFPGRGKTLTESGAANE